MIIYPAIDIIDGCAVRLIKGDYSQKTVYSNDPAQVALDFKAAGARRIHIVDLEGAKDGGIPNFDTVVRIKETSGLFCEIGGGVRSVPVIEKYLGAGIDRVILGTAALDRVFLAEVLAEFGEKIAVGVDIKDGRVAVKGWKETVEIDAFDFCREAAALGAGCIICTDISKDGMLGGANIELYRRLAGDVDIDITASGGVSYLEDVKTLDSLGLHGAIIGKAYYTGTIDLAEAILAAGS